MTKAIVLGIVMLFLGTSLVQNIKTTVKADPTDGLVGYWNFDNQANPGLDNSGNDKNGEVNGATWTSEGKVNGALDFDGVDDCVDLPDNNFKFQTFSISCWVYCDSYGYYPPIFSVCNQAAYGGWVLEQGVRYSDETFNFVTVNPAGHEIDLINSQPIVTSHWYHIVGVKTPSYMRIYIDGVLAEEDTSVSPVVYTGIVYGDDFLPFIGCVLNVHIIDRYFDGKIDEVRIYNRALSSSEIQYLHDNPGGVPPVNHPPILSEGKVTPLLALPDSIFTYEVKYTDPDGDIPSMAKVIITINSIDQISFPMTLAESGVFFYETGAKFQCKIDLSEALSEQQINEAASSRKLGYYFYFEDGHGGHDYFPLSESLPGPDVWLLVTLLGTMAKATAENLVAVGEIAKVLPYIMLGFVPNVFSDFYYKLNGWAGNYYAVSIGCPVNITITDQFGRITNNNGLNNIPNTYILKIYNITIFFIPENLTSNIKINATDEGRCSILKSIVESENNVSIIGKFNIPLTEMTKINLTLNFSTLNYFIYVDSDGNDIIDEVYTSDFSTIQYCDYPIAFFTNTPQEPVIYQPIQFNASLSIYSSNLNVDYSWDFGDGTTGEGKLVSHTYVRAGNYTVMLNLTDEKEQSSIYQCKIFIKDIYPPVTTITIGEPKFDEIEEWVTPNTSFNLTANDNSGGLGVNYIYYRIWYTQEWTPWIKYFNNFTLSGEGKHYLEYFSVDNAGNVEETYNQTYYIDDSPPIVTISASPNALWPPNHKMKNVLISGSATDAGTGIATITFTVVDEYGQVQPTITHFGQTIQLEAWRNGNDMDGRAYTITAIATDNLGHAATASTVVLVPHDQG